MKSRRAALELLRSTGWFSQVDIRLQTLLSAYARVLSYEPGETIFQLGDPEAGLFGIAGGSVVLSFPREDGLVVPIATLGAGHWLGDLSILSSRPSLVGIEARSAVTVVNISANRIGKIVKDTPEHFEDFFALNRLNREVSLRLLAAMTAETAERRIVLRLAILSTRVNQTPGWIDVTHSDLSQQLGISVPTVQRALKRLVASGAIEQRYGQLRILDADALSHGVGA